MRRALAILAASALACVNAVIGGYPDATSGGGDAAVADGASPIADAGLPGPTALRIDPPAFDLRTDGRTPARAPFRVLARYPDGREAAVAASFQIGDRRLVRVEGDTLVSATFGGETLLAATFEGVVTQAMVRVRLEQSASEGMLPAGIDALIANAPEDPRRAPAIVYPNADVLVPPNLGAIEVHFTRGAADNALFSIELSAPHVSLRVHTRCAAVGMGCVFTLGGALWTNLAESARGGDPVSLRVIGLDEVGRGKGASPAQRLSVTAQSIAGALYYWTTAPNAAIMRSEFGASTPPERFFPFTGNTCHGCHALSPNGQRMSLTVGGNLKAQLGLIDVGARQVLLEPSDAEQDQLHSWDPWSELFAAVYSEPGRVDTNIRIRDGNSGLVTETIDVGVEPDHPDWSPRGDRIAFTIVGQHNSTQRPLMGGIGYIDNSAGPWGAARTLIAPEAGRNRYYPTYSPDGRFIVYDESTCPGGQVNSEECDADTDPSAKLWAIPADGGTRVMLANANAPGAGDGRRTDLTNSYPRWAPFVDRRKNDGTERVMWMSFSSQRAYGLKQPSGRDTWLWMAAIDPDAILAGRDGSAPAFALPAQDFRTSNHIAQWAARIAPDPGTVPEGCVGFGDPCQAANDQCCPGASCADQGGGIFRCKPSL